MVRNHHARSLRTLAIAIMLAVSAIGMCQFAFSPTYPPDLCLGVTSPGERVCYWFKSGRQLPISELFDHYELARSASSTVCIVLLAAALAWSIRNQGLLSLRFRIRTLMVTIAVLPVAWLAGQAAWETWQRFDDYYHYADRVSPYAELESRLPELPADPSAYVYGVEVPSDK